MMTEQRTDRIPQILDVAVVGGGAAGLSAALTLARARRTVMVIDAGAPRNAPAAGVHGFLTRDGVSPLELLALGRREVEQYGGIVLPGTATGARRTADGFEVRLADGQAIVARRLIVTTGLTDQLPDISGLRERWGHDVLHCPYCHGWEVQDQPVGIVNTGPFSVHQASLFRQWTSDVILFTHTGPALTDAQTEGLTARGVRIVPGTVVAVEVEDDRLAGVRLDDGTLVARRALVVAPRFVANSEILAGLGLGPAVHPLGIGEQIDADATGQTAEPGVWVAGNVANVQAQVVTAAAGGVAAGAAVNADLIAEETRQAVAAYRAVHPAAAQYAVRRAS